MNVDLLTWGNWVEREKRARIKLCVAAYAYEVENSPIISDAQFDALARAIDPNLVTGVMDEWWRINFDSNTGQWIHKHPDIAGIKKLYLQFR